MALDIPKLVENGLSTVFDVADSLVVSADFVFPDASPVYDPDTSSLTASNVTVSGVSVILYDFRASKIDGDLVLVGDQMLLVQKSGLGANVLTTKTTITVSGAKRHVVSFKTLPTEGSPKAYLIHIRKSP